MQIEVPHPAFVKQQLTVETAGLFSGPKLLLNGVLVEKLKGRYTVSNDDGEEITIQLKHNYIDPIPKIKIGDETETLADPLAWYEWLFIGLPLVLLFIGGAIGGILGVVAATANGRLIRGDSSAAHKYIHSTLITAFAFILFFAIAIPLQSLRQPSAEKQLQQMAAEFNQGGPRKVDEFTRLDGIVAGPGLMLTYRFTMENLTQSTAPPHPAVFQSQYGAEIKRRVCASEVKQLLDQKVTVKYLYHENGGSPIGEVRIAPGDCR